MSDEQPASGPGAAATPPRHPTSPGVARWPATVALAILAARAINTLGS